MRAGTWTGSGAPSTWLDATINHWHKQRRATHCSGCRQLCVRAQPCMQGSGDAAYLLCMLGAVSLVTSAAAQLAASVKLLSTSCCGLHFIMKQVACSARSMPFNKNE
jgi:hypothetical protein